MICGKHLYFNMYNIVTSINHFNEFNELKICIYVFANCLECLSIFFALRGACVCDGLPRRLSSKESACQCRIHRRCGFSLRIGKLPWRRAWQPTPVFLPRESPWTEEPGGLQSIGSWRVGHEWSDLAHMGAHTHTYTHTHKVHHMITVTSSTDKATESLATP